MPAISISRKPYEAGEGVGLDVPDAVQATNGSRPMRSGAPDARFKFGTKAETLARLKGLLTQARILDLVYFSVAEWRNRPEAVRGRITEAFGTATVAVRSSALAEDGAGDSMAGAFCSRLDVAGDDPAGLAGAIDEVIASYTGNPKDQVLVQPMLQAVALSGVLMTHDLEHGAPFYIIEYDDESGATDSVTGGTHVYKALQVFRHGDPRYVGSPRMIKVLEMARELEKICGPVPLDIEFALGRDGILYLLQCRRIGLQRNWLAGTETRISKRLTYVESFLSERSAPRAGLAGTRTILGIMPDWNPAEIIGVTPRPLALSLYRELVTRCVWREAREIMGYRVMPSEELLVSVGGRPYVDVRNSFNSFLPAGLPETLETVLVDAWLARLAAHPELHDKVEFEIVHTCLDFDFEESIQERYPKLLSTPDLAAYRTCLRRLTERALRPGSDGGLSTALDETRRLAQRQDLRRLEFDPFEGSFYLSHVANLIAECQRSGTLPFAIVARHAFIAEALLWSAVRRGALSVERLGTFKRSVRTVLSDLTSDFAEVCRGRKAPEQFMDRYGHLRPGTYDISSLRYDQRDDLFADIVMAEPPEPVVFALTDQERSSLDELLAESGLRSMDGEALIDYARRAISGREYAKFVFTRNLSDALEAIAAWGECLGLDREALSFIPLDAILDTLMTPVLDDSDLYFLDLAEQGRRAMDQAQALKLGYLIRDARDLYVVPMHRSAPNFVGRRRIEGRPLLLGPVAPATVDLYDRIVCIENADPGYDWIFTKGLKGLVTKFGGANSHMAIRCAEFGLPAAIGCGEKPFERLTRASAIELDPAGKIIRPLGAS